MENIFKCTFCEEGFNLTNKVPKMLTQCGHSICLECLEQNLKNNKNIRCDIDDQIINTQNTTQKDYPRNLALIQYLEQRNPDSLNQTLENINCSEYFSQNEKQPDLQSVATDKKQFLEKIKVMEEFIAKRSMSDSFSEEENVNGICQMHNINQDVFCETCEEWICHKCGLFGGHKSHTMSNGDCFKEKANQFCKEVLEILAKIEREENYMKDEFIEIFFASKSSKNLKRLQKQVRDQYKQITKQLKEQKEDILKQIDSKIQECEEVLQEKIDEHIEKFNDRSTGLKRNLKTITQEINRKKNKEKIYLYVQKQNPNIIQTGKNLAESIQSDIKILKRRISKFFEEFDIGLSQQQLKMFVLKQPDIEVIKGKKEQSFSREFDDLNYDEQDSILTLGKRGEKFGQFLPTETSNVSSQKKNDKNINFNSNPFMSSQNENVVDKKTLPQSISKKAFVKKKIQVKEFKKSKNRSLQKPIKKLLSRAKLKKVEKKKENSDELKDFQRCKTSHKIRAQPQQLQSAKRNNSFLRKKSLFNSNTIKVNQFQDQSMREKLLAPRRRLSSSSLRQIQTSYQKKDNNQYETLFSSMKKQNQVLNFDDSNLQDSFLSKFNDYLKDSENVKVLILSNNKFTDKGVQQVCGMISNMNIQTLDLSGNFLTKKSIQFLRELCMKNKSIKRIVFQKSPLSRDQIEDLTAEFKQKGIEFQF